jgi:hypothetical protein
LDAGLRGIAVVCLELAQQEHLQAARAPAARAPSPAVKKDRPVAALALWFKSVAAAFPFAARRSTAA